MDGAETLRIGELAVKANVTKRTIDYYTNMGLLEATRSSSNYRFYNQNELDKLMFIEACKKKNMTLTEIKDELIKRNECLQKLDDIDQLKDQILHLNKDVGQVLKMIENLDPDERKLLRKQLTQDHLALIQSLVLLLM
ncbi:MerR family transcriptional regulator [Metabacillus arenae]|uniref:MerR family transcriptional regulator n=1 Tax=Metabacillus arenae TaxID=2771434 RepID=A0A926NK29_9BACI|nr:MerR family transcriptional regulator [Metabacillus arenae]MBD1382215.1 MerR family transcriptional regulator [Metabacillus arenae]